MAKVKTVIVVSAEATFANEAEKMVKGAGGNPVLVDHAAAMEDAISREFPLLVVIDGTTPGRWMVAVRHCKLRPQTQQIPVYLFADEDEVTENAQKAEIQTVVDGLWPRSTLSTQLPALVDLALHPPTMYPAGWDDQLSALARRGIEEFNRRDYFEQHEYLEEAWIAESRPIRDLYQGILQVGLAFLQIERNNWRGAVKMFRRGLPKLRTLPAVCQGIDLAHFRATAEQIHTEIVALGAQQLSQFDQQRFPQISLSPRTDESGSPINGKQTH